MNRTEASISGQEVAQAGEPWPATVERMLDPVYRFVQTRVPAHAVDDIVQETFMAASRGIAGFDGRSSIWTWLTVIARHKIADLYRRTGETSLLAVALEDLDPQGRPIEESLASELPLPDQICERKEFQLLARAAMSALSPDDQVCLAGRYDEDLSLDELALRLGVTKAAVNTRLYRARQELKASFLRLFQSKGELEQESVR